VYRFVAAQNASAAGGKSVKSREASISISVFEIASVAPKLTGRDTRFSTSTSPPKSTPSPAVFDERSNGWEVFGAMAEAHAMAQARKQRTRTKSSAANNSLNRARKKHF
jgi:hypothetical protein